MKLINNYINRHNPLELLVQDILGRGGEFPMEFIYGFEIRQDVSDLVWEVRHPIERALRPKYGRIATKNIEMFLNDTLISKGYRLFDELDPRGKVAQKIEDESVPNTVLNNIGSMLSIRLGNDKDLL